MRPRPITIRMISATLRAIAERFEEEKIVIPFPQRDLHIHSITDEAALRALGDQESG